MAAGLFQDLSTHMGQEVSVFLERLMDTVFMLLREPSIPIDLKNLAVLICGDVCLMTEENFLPYF